MSDIENTIYEYLDYEPKSFHWCGNNWKYCDKKCAECIYANQTTTSSSNVDANNSYTTNTTSNTSSSTTNTTKDTF